MTEKLKVLFFCLFAGCFWQNAIAQQDPQFSQNMYNIFTVNPGYAGTNGAICGVLFYRPQWVGFVGAPKTGLLSVHAPVKILRGGVGGTIYSDQLGVDETFGAKFAYAYHLHVGPGLLGIGLQGGFVSKTLRANELEPYINDGTDITIPSKTETASTSNMDFGIYYNMELLYVGISTTQILESPAKYKNLNYTQRRHYYLTAGYVQRITQTVELLPSIWLKSEGRGFQIDVNLLALYNSQFWGGFSYRYQDAIVPMIGVLYNNIKIGYSYDITTTSLRGYSNGTHEIMIGYCFKPAEKKSAERYRNVRFL